MEELARKNNHLTVIKVKNPTSKADNVNHFCEIVDTSDSDVTAILDCDHYPHPYGPRWAMDRFKADHKIDTVQGRCMIQNASQGLLVYQRGLRSKLTRFMLSRILVEQPCGTLAFPTVSTDAGGRH